jgi:hypothetical protein
VGEEDAVETGSAGIGGHVVEPRQLLAQVQWLAKLHLVTFVLKNLK